MLGTCRVAIVFLAFLLATSCTDKQKHSYEADTFTYPEIPHDAEGLDTSPEDVEEDTYSIYTDPCVDCAMYFCPPLDSVWQKQICINNCDDPPTVVYEGECEEYLQCDPTQPIIEVDLPCMTDDGYPGTQDKLCSKGQIQYTGCETECEEEICDGKDNDCDDIIDEGF